MSEWFKYDGRDEETELDAQLEPHERAAVAAMSAIEALVAANPDKALIIAASLRKLSTVAGSRAASLNLRSITVKRGGR